MRWIPLVAALLVTWAPSAQPTPDAAEAAVVAFAEHQRAGDWRALADVLAPDIVETLGQFTIDYGVQMRRAADSLRVGAVVSREFEDEPDVWIARFDSMSAVVFQGSPDVPSPQEAFARVLGAYVARTPYLQEALSETSFRPAGAIVEGDSLAYVVGHVTSLQTGLTVAVPDMVVVRWIDGRWAIDARHDGDNSLVETVRFWVRNWTEALSRAAGFDDQPSE